ncbi:MAG: hypothetical protein IKX54_05745 [Lachnospiraceae bacterium]|nr:hypothetical protein [Lachnospiraceae bacterium]
MLKKLERKFGRYAIQGLMKYLMLLYGLGFIIFAINQHFYYDWLMLDVEKTFCHFQLWRLVTFLIQPIEKDNFIIVLFMMYLYYFIGNMLELKWGAFRFNLFYFAGVLFNILLCVLVYLVYFVVTGTGRSPEVGLGYINLAMMFAFATEFGDLEFLLFFLIPVKVKYVALFTVALYAYDFIKVYVQYGLGAFLLVFIPFVIGIFNFLIYWIVTRKQRNIRRRTVADLRRRMAYTQSLREGSREGSVVNSAGNRKVVTKHRCAVCGRTELDDDMLEFRFCSKCEGNYEYCMDHLYTHTHVKREKAGTYETADASQSGSAGTAKDMPERTEDTKETE